MNKRNSVLAVLAVLGGISATPPALAVDDDSVNSWGRWGQLVAPAAGPEVQIQPAVLVTNQVSRDLRPEEGAAFSRQVLALQADGGSGGITPLPVVELPVEIPGGGNPPVGTPGIDRPGRVAIPTEVGGNELPPGGSPGIGRPPRGDR